MSATAIVAPNAVPFAFPPQPVTQIQQNPLFGRIVRRTLACSWLTFVISMCLPVTKHTPGYKLLSLPFAMIRNIAHGNYESFLYLILVVPMLSILASPFMLSHRGRHGLPFGLMKLFAALGILATAIPTAASVGGKLEGFQIGFLMFAVSQMLVGGAIGMIEMSRKPIR